MLVACGPDGQRLTAREISPTQLREWSRARLLTCPNCHAPVHLRGGAEKRRQLHFAHQKGECAWSTEPESERHAQGKVTLAHWLQQQYPAATITLEQRLPEPNRIADIFVAHPDGTRWAIEFQCAHLERERWQKRHIAYRRAGIIDIWIIGNNRRNKHEAFLEAIFSHTHELLFLDPLVTPACSWLRWPVSPELIQDRQLLNYDGAHATLTAPLNEFRLIQEGSLRHPIRDEIDERARLLRLMHARFDPRLLLAYLRSRVEQDVLTDVLRPLLKAYLLDPHLLQRYNYGRGTLTPAEQERIDRARDWLVSLDAKGYTRERLRALVREIPFVNAYAAFATYFELLLSLP